MSGQNQKVLVMIVAVTVLFALNDRFLRLF